MPTTPRWAGLGGRAHGDERAPGAPFVFLHGLTFDSQMWGPVLDALPSGHRAVAFDRPGHGSSAALPLHGHAAVVEAVQEAVLDAGLDAPILVGHSIGGSLATNYAAKHPAVAVVSVDAPVRLEPFVQLLRSLRPQLAGEGFAEAWAIYQDSWHMELLPDEDRAILGAGDRPGDDALRRLALSYQSDLLERPLEETVRARRTAEPAPGGGHLLSHPPSLFDRRFRQGMASRAAAASRDPRLAGRTPLSTPRPPGQFRRPAHWTCSGSSADHAVQAVMSASERDLAHKHGLALRDPARPELGWRRTTTLAIPNITGGRLSGRAPCSPSRKDQS